MVPQQIKILLKTRFDYPSHIIIAQVATLSDSGPDLRSMGLFDIDEQGRLIFLTNTFSHKWTQLSSRPEISVLLLNLQQDTQIIGRGYAELLTKDSSPDLSELYWHRVPEGAKQTYAHENPENSYTELNTSFKISTPPKNFGIIRIAPKIWEFLDMDIQNYPASYRVRYEWNKTKWEETRLNAI